MTITGHYDGTIVRLDTPSPHLKKNQKVLITPLSDRKTTGTSAAGSLKQYANPALIDQEKDAWGKVATEKYEKPSTP